MTIADVLAGRKHWHVEVADALEGLGRIPDGSVQTIVTSPPYFQLRDYKTAAWDGGSVSCDHVNGRALIRPGSRCPLCGAERVDRQIGLEGEVDEFVDKLVAVFRECRRVLRDDGTLWLNMGNTYSGSGKGVWTKSTQKERYVPEPGELLTNRELSGYPRKCLIPVAWLLGLGLIQDGWILRSDVIWCLSPSTVVYAKTQKRAMPMTIHDLVRLAPETVKLWNGERWTKVLGWSQSRTATDPIVVTLRSGERITCTEGHQWPTKRGLLRADELVVGDELVTTRLPEPESPLGSSVADELAWFAGLYLAEGSRSGNTISIAGHVNATERWERVRTLARQYGGSATLCFHEGNSASIRVHSSLLDGAIRHFIAGQTAKDKHVHPRAWAASNESLTALLMGYLSGDGHFDKANNRWRLGFTNNHLWAQDLRTLAARLDITLSLRPSLAKIGRTRVFDAYRGELRFSRTGHHNERAMGEIVEIGKGRQGVFYDIGVADEPHTFALASGVLTHNSKPTAMPSSVTDRPTTAHEYVLLLSKSPRYYYDSEAIKEPAKGAEVSRNIRSVWSICSEPLATVSTFDDGGEGLDHFAAFPTELARRCIAASTSEAGACPSCGAGWKRVTETERVARGDRFGKKTKGLFVERGQGGRRYEMSRTSTTGWRPGCDCGQTDMARPVVLDPFSGSGRTILTALRLGRAAIGIELSPKSAQLASRQILLDAPLLNAVGR